MLQTGRETITKQEIRMRINGNVVRGCEISLYEKGGFSSER